MTRRIITATGREYDTRIVRGRCAALLDYRTPDVRCGAECDAAHVVGVDMLRQSAVRAEPLCAAHGGVEEQCARYTGDWMLAAPASVVDVLDAGCMALQSPDAIVQIRPERGRWLAWRGIGGMMIQVRNPAHRPKTRSDGSPRTRGGKHGQRPAGGCAFATQADALDSALAAWRTGVAARVAEVAAARGGTLAWGMPIEPASSPRVILLREGENAWDAFSRKQEKPAPPTP